MASEGVSVKQSVGDRWDRTILYLNGPNAHDSIWLLERWRVPLYIPQHNSDKLIWCHPHCFSRAPSQLVLLPLWVEEWTDEAPHTDTPLLA